MGVDDPADAHPAAGDFLDHERVGEEGFAQASVLLGDHQSEDAQLLEPVDDVLGVFVVVLQLVGNREDLGIDEFTDGREDVALNLGQALGL